MGGIVASPTGEAGSQDGRKVVMAQRATIAVSGTVSGTASWVVIRVAGAGTIVESPVVSAFAEKVLAGGTERVIVDLADCTYLDSTVLGGLVGLFRRNGAERFAIYAPDPLRRSLFGVSRLDTILPFADELPASSDGAPTRVVEIEARPAPMAPGSPPVPGLPGSPGSSDDELARYVADCHRRLAELGGPEAQEFARVADAIAAEAHAGTGADRNRRP
jgi:anti-sigma B factor antagonist